MSKRPKPPADLPEKRPPMSPGEIATTAFRLALLQAHDDNVDVYEMLALLSLESLALLCGRDPAIFGYLLNGLGIYADYRRAECLHSALAGQPPPPLGKVFEPPVSIN
jgi:hypothetical protein